MKIRIDKILIDLPNEKKITELTSLFKGEFEKIFY